MLKRPKSCQKGATKCQKPPSTRAEKVRDNGLIPWSHQRGSKLDGGDLEQSPEHWLGIFFRVTAFFQCPTSLLFPRVTDVLYLIIIYQSFYLLKAS